MARDQKKPSAPQAKKTPRPSGLIGRGGKVDPAAVHRAVHGPPGAAGPKDDIKAAASDGDGTPDDAVIAVNPAVPDDDAPNRVVFKLGRDLNKRLDKYLSDRIGFMSRTQLQRLIDEGGVTVNARAPKAATKLRLGDVIEVFVPPPPSSEIAPEDIPLRVLFEDERIIVLNKSPDIIVHPARSHLSGTMINALAYHFQHRSATGGRLSPVGREFARPGVVHRLDRHTSGVIVFAKDEEAHWRLGRQFELRQVDKRYLAVAHGLYAPPIDTIDLPIGPHPSREKGYREKYVIRHDELGKPALTIARVLARFQVQRPSEVAAATAFSVLELDLKTGRTHQIRVHLSHLGHPIVGDDMYGGKAVHPRDLGLAPGDEPLIARQALHAAMLSFRHPFTNEPMTFRAPLPADMAGLLAALTSADPREQPQAPPGTVLNLDSLSAEQGSPNRDRLAVWGPHPAPQERAERGRAS